MLHYFPTEALMQHEWKAHGTCSGLSVDDYFAAVKKARDSVKIPDELIPASRQSMTPADVEGKVAAANPGFPKTAFRSSCYPDKELQEIRICLNKDLSPRACGSSAGQCSAKEVTLLPVH
jgi:ribonuclease T2